LKIVLRIKGHSLCTVTPVTVGELRAVDIEDDSVGLPVNLDEFAAFTGIGVAKADQGVSLTNGVATADNVREVSFAE